MGPVFLMLAALCGGDPATAPSVQEVRTAIERSIPYIEKAGASWIEQKKCVTCHRVGNMLWSLEAAHRRGFGVDAAKLAETTAWTIDWSLQAPKATDPKDNDPKDSDPPNNDPKDNDPKDPEEAKEPARKTNGERDGVAQVLLAQAEAGKKSSDELLALAQIVIRGQQADGSWKPGGQLPGQKRPLPETTAVSTMWQTLSLANISTPEANDSRSRALAWLEKSPLAKSPLEASPLEKSAPQQPAPKQSAMSTEWYAVRLVLEDRLGDKSRVAMRREELLNRQRDDGGWNWVEDDKHDPSDALATGMAIWALASTGLDPRDPAIGRAMALLVATQEPDGSWAVRGTKSGKRTLVQETARYWGTTWAVLGMVATIRE